MVLGKILQKILRLQQQFYTAIHGFSYSYISLVDDGGTKFHLTLAGKQRNKHISNLPVNL